MEPQGPFPFPSPSTHSDENDGDDVVHNVVDVLFPVWLLVVPLLLYMLLWASAPHVHCFIELKIELGL